MRDDDGRDRSDPGRRGSGPVRRASLPDGEVEATGDATVVTNLDDLAQKAQDERLHPHLIVIAGDNVGKYYRLDRSVVYLGRGETCEVQIHDSGISRKHSRVLVAPDGEVWLEDLGSTNGTFVENRRVDRYLLRDGDRIQLGRTTIIKFSVTDTTEMRFAEHMYVSATHDALTRLNNRQFFDEQFRTEFSFATRHKVPLSVLMIDIDHFKRVNDTYGHATGDLALKVVARTLARIVRTEDVVARYGGEEFVVLTRGTDRAAARVLAERVRHTIETQLVPNPGGAFRITVSVGTATLADSALLRTRADLVGAADAALYRAKEAGRNRIEQWNHGDPINSAGTSVPEETSA